MKMLVIRYTIFIYNFKMHNLEGYKNFMNIELPSYLTTKIAKIWNKNNY